MRFMKPTRALLAAASILAVSATIACSEGQAGTQPEQAPATAAQPNTKPALPTLSLIHI
ncbi:MAG: hypothetical protein KUG77_12020 [Nannocystaceae bacterium]|nr:hypothetical protein [Nannocystaceae bacterium]